MRSIVIPVLLCESVQHTFYLRLPQILVGCRDTNDVTKFRKYGAQYQTQYRETSIGRHLREGAVPFRYQGVLPKLGSLFNLSTNNRIAGFLLRPSQMSLWHYVQCLDIGDKGIDLLAKDRKVSPPDATPVLVVVAVIKEMEQIGQML